MKIVNFELMNIDCAKYDVFIVYVDHLVGNGIYSVVWTQGVALVCVTKLKLYFTSSRIC